VLTPQRVLAQEFLMQLVNHLPPSAQFPHWIYDRDLIWKQQLRNDAINAFHDLAVSFILN
jgi:hypothetical protein